MKDTLFDSARRLFTYDQYLTHIAHLLESGQVTGNEQTEDRKNMTTVGLHRMNRLNKSLNIELYTLQVLKAVKRKMNWYVLIEGWCADGAQILPYLSGIAMLNDHIDLKLLLRDDNPEVMDAYLTNGARAIPKLIATDAETGEELFTWGPRPKALIQAIESFKKEQPGYEKSDFHKMLQVWYNKDKGRSIQKEISSLLLHKTTLLEKLAS